MMPENTGVASVEVNGVVAVVSEAGGSGPAIHMADHGDAIKGSSMTNGGSLKNGFSPPKPKNFRAGFKINQLADMLAKRSLQMVEGCDGEGAAISTVPTVQSNSLPPPFSSQPATLEERISPTISNTPLLITNQPVMLEERLLPAISETSLPKNDNSCEISSAPEILCPPLLVASLHPPPSLTLVGDLSKQSVAVCTAESYKTESPIQELPLPAIEPSVSPPPPTLTPPPEQQPPVLEPEVAPPVPTALQTFEDSTKTQPVRSRTSPRSKKQVGAVEGASRSRNTRRSTRRSKNLVETSTQTAEIPFSGCVREAEAITPDLPPQLTTAPSPPAMDPPVLKPAVPVIPPTYICLFCHLTFVEKTDCLNHEATHTLKRKTKFIKCQFCMKKLPNLEDFKSHCVKHHSSNFFLCSECDLRFFNELSLANHTKNDHYNPVERTHFNIFNKKVRTSGTNLDIDVNCDATKRPSVSPRCVQKISPKERTEEQLYEAEMLFYSHLPGNIQDNLSNHLDGKIGRSENGSDILDNSKSTGSLLTVASSSNGSSSIPVNRAPSPYQTRSKTPNPLPTSAKKFKKLPNWQQKFWEKYNFPTNYRFEHRFGDKNYANMDKSPFNLKDLSCLDIKTQLTMRENLKKLEEVPEQEKVGDKDSFPYCVGLIPVPVTPVVPEIPPPSIEIIKLPKKKVKDVKSSRRSRFIGEKNGPQVVTRRQSCLEKTGNPESGADSKMTLRRQASSETVASDVSPTPASTSLDAAGPSPESVDTETSPDLFLGTSDVSGEWVRPRSYLCGACCVKFSNLWDLEDHKWAVHPNVWCTHYEFEVQKLDQVFHLEDEQEQVAKISLSDLYRRCLSPKGFLSAQDVLTGVSFPHACSKCTRLCQNQTELHRHILDCGGDTTWSQTMCSSPATLKRRWRPYGSRRRKPTAQRGVKRTITSTPPLRTYITQPKIRTKPGDVETIQKMLANLPEKRTRRAINFDEVSTRSQTTIQNNRLLRKRLGLGNNNVGTAEQRKTPRSEVKNVSSSSRRKGNLKDEPSVESPSDSASTPDKETKTAPNVQSTQLRKVPVVKATKLKINKIERKLKDKVISVENVKTPPPKSTPLHEKTKKKIVQRKGYLIKNIKKRLTTSKKLMEARRRSDRIKNMPKDNDSDFTTEESLPISKLKEIKKKASTLPMPQVHISQADQDISNIIKGTKSPKREMQPPPVAEVPENIVIKVMRRKYNRKSKRSVTLKVVRKPLLPKPPEASGEVVDTEVKVIGLATPEKPVETIESESVISVQPEPIDPVNSDKVICDVEYNENTGIKDPGLSDVVEPIKRISIKRNRRRTGVRKKKPTKKDVVPNSIEQSDLFDKSLTLQEGKKSNDLSNQKVPSPNKQLPETSRLPVEVVSKITEGPHENLVKRKSNRKHDRAKNNGKGLRMTVTLREATLKVLNKPAVAPGPSKWTSVNPVDGVIKFEIPTNIPAIGSCVASDSAIAAEPVVIVNALPPRKSRRLSKNTEISDETGTLNQKKAVVPDVSLDVSAVPSEGTTKTCISPVREIEAVPSESVAKSKQDFELSEPGEVPVDSSSITLDTSKSSEDVSTTVHLEESVVSDKTNVVSSMAADSCSVRVVGSTSEVKSIMPIFTIEEATSSEDVTKPTNKSSCSPKIAEADSTGEKMEIVSSCEASSYEMKIEPEMVVSSTNPLGQTRKRKKRQSVVEFDCKDEAPSSTLLIPEELDRRSRRKSREIPVTNEFVIDDPLLLVDELWSDLDSDSDSKKKKVRRIKKKAPKKKVPTNKEVDLEALLRNFGENKSDLEQPFVKCLPMRRAMPKNWLTSRQRAENRVVICRNAHRRLFAKLFSFNKKIRKHGRIGGKLLVAKKSLQQVVLTTLPSVVTENPEQVIVCRLKQVRKKKASPKCRAVPTLHNFKVSVPLELLGDLSLFNNNHLTCSQVPEIIPVPPKPEESIPTPIVESKLSENKPRRTDCIDKIFSCEICTTYYYSFCQLRTHKQSNRHKQNELKYLQEHAQPGTSDSPVATVVADDLIEDKLSDSSNRNKSISEEKAPDIPPLEDKNDDSSEMPVLEGPFIETRPLEPIILSAPPELPAPPPSVFEFSAESLKNIQKAIGCTDEEMLILTLLGENSAPEPNLLDLSNCTPKPVKTNPVEQDTLRPNGALKVDLKQRMNSALSSLVNRAVQNFHNKSAAVSKSSEKSDVITFLNKLSVFSDGKKSTAIQQETPTMNQESRLKMNKEHETYRYKCEICGNRFEKESTRDFHIARTHNKRKSKFGHDHVDDWSTWTEPDDMCLGPSSQFLCSDCGINFGSPQEVLEHQKSEHSTDQRADDGTRKGGRSMTQRRCSELDPEEAKILANQALQKLAGRRCDRKSWGSKLYSVASPKLKKVDIVNDAVCANAMSQKGASSTKAVDVYDFNEFESDTELVALTHVKKPAAAHKDDRIITDDDSEDVPLASVKKPLKEPDVSFQKPPSPELEPPVAKPIEKKDNFKISLENKLLDLATLPHHSQPSESEDDSLPLLLMSKKDSPKSPESSVVNEDVSDYEERQNIIYEHNDSNTSHESSGGRDLGAISDGEKSWSNISVELPHARRHKKVVPSLSATLTDASNKKGDNSNQSIVQRIWIKPVSYDEDMESDIDKETIMKKVWKKKRNIDDSDGESSLSENIQIKQTEISHEVVIKCGPKESRRKSENEPAKTAIVGKIWSGKCGIQTKAALKTYDSDLVPESVPVSLGLALDRSVPVAHPVKRRSRPSNVATAKRRRNSKISEDDLESLLDEIEQEDVERAIRSEFLHLRRSEKSHTEPPKEPPGLFAENAMQGSKREKKKRMGLKNRVLSRSDGSDASRRHKKHRHRHHHHKHKHKKSRHRKNVVNRHKSKHRGERGSSAGADPFSVLERMCQDIPATREASPAHRTSGEYPYIQPRISTDLDNLDMKLDQILSPLETANRIRAPQFDDDSNSRHS